MEQIEKIQGTEKEFIKVFQELCYSRSSWQVWADLMAAMACTLANSVDKTEPRYTAREKEYAECIKRLGGVEKPAKCFAIVVEALERNPNQDFLGKLYMSLELGNHWKGQFFTPYNVCECMAGITINDNVQTLEKQEWIEKKVSAEERLPGDMYNMQTTMENKDNMIARLEKELSTVQSKKTKAIEALAKLRLEKQKIAGESSGNDAVLLWAEKIKEKRKENSNV